MESSFEDIRRKDFLPGILLDVFGIVDILMER